MKKALYGTTALIAAGALMASPASAEDKIKLNVGGYWQTVLSYVNQDDDTPGAPGEWQPVNVRQEGEVHFTGSTTLDNGITFGVNLQLEAVTQADQIDESFMFIEGSFGRVLIGAENSAPYLMGYVAPSVALGVNSPNFLLFQTNGVAGTSTVIDVDTSDANKITYFTPRFSGFQLGVSYTPNDDVRGGDRQTAGLNSDDDIGDLSDFVSIGANFTQSFEGFDVAISGGYVFASEEQDSLLGDDLSEFGVGAEVGFAGFTVGGSYNHSNNGVDNDGDTDAWDIGAAYSTGPWGISFTYIQSETEQGANIEDWAQQFEIGLSYAVGPGITVVASGQYREEDNDTTFDTDGVAFALGTKLSF